MIELFAGFVAAIMVLKLAVAGFFLASVMALALGKLRILLIGGANRQAKTASLPGQGLGAV